MSGYVTEDEVRDEYIRRMGRPLGAVFSALTRELVWLHVKWGEYMELFGTSPERIELLNNAAPTFFGIVQNIMWEDSMRHIARLTDPPKSVRKENLTIKTLPDLVSPKFRDDCCLSRRSREDQNRILQRLEESSSCPHGSISGVGR
jgi:AbiU2